MDDITRLKLESLRYEVRPDAAISAEVPKTLGRVIDLQTVDGRLVAITASGVPMIVPMRGK